jgi:hypothetical protein
VSKLVEHAQRELELLGEFKSDPAYAQSIVCAVAAFAAYGHSGGSASAGVAVLKRLLEFRNLSPLTDDPKEWMEVDDSLMWQNRRNGEAFSGDGGKTYWLLSEGAHSGSRSPLHNSAHREEED